MPSTKTRRKYKLRAIELKGGKCSICGYNRCPAALQFHHIVGKKDSNINEMMRSFGWPRIELELAKCILVCSNCHAEIHNKELL